MIADNRKMKIGHLEINDDLYGFLELSINLYKSIKSYSSESI